MIAWKRNWKTGYIERRSFFLFSLSMLVFCAAPVYSDSGKLAAAKRAVLETAFYMDSLGKYETSALEYERFLFFWPEDSMVPRVLYELGNAYRRLGKPKRAVAVFGKLLRTSKSPAWKARARYQLGLCMLETHDLDAAKLEFLRSAAVSKGDTSLKIAAMSQVLLLDATRGEWKACSLDLDHLASWGSKRSGFSALLADADSILKQMSMSDRKRSVRTAKFLSSMLPGLGQVYAGSPGAGLDAFLLNSLNFFVSYKQFADGKVPDGFLYSVGVTLRYYLGNIFRAGHIVAQKRELRKRRYLSSLVEVLRKLRMMTGWDESPSQVNRRASVSGH